MYKRLAAGLLAVGISGSVFAAPGASLQNVFNNIAVDGSNDVDVTTDYLSEDMDSLWAVAGSNLGSATMIIELAGYANANTFGIYQDGQYVQMFAGTDAAGAQKVLQIDGAGNVKINFADTGVDFTANSDGKFDFGFYLHSPAGLFHSETDLNSDGFDHMYAYQGVGEDVDLDGSGTLFGPGEWTTDEYILGWEDLYGGGDQDFADMVVMIESITPVPEPGVIALIGAGLIGLGIARRKKVTC